MNVPYCDDARVLRPYATFIGDLVEAAAKSGNFILKSLVEELEQSAGQLFNETHVTALSNTADAATIALRVMGVEHGTEVLFSALAPADLVFAAVVQGAQPVFFDEYPNRPIDVGSLTRLLSQRCRALVLGRWTKQNDDLRALISCVRNSGIPVLEEASVLCSSAYSSNEESERSDLKIVSVGPRSAVTGIGDGALLMGRDDKLIRRARMLRNHGQDGVTRFRHHEIGYNHRMDEIAAGFVLKRLSELPAIVEDRRRILNEYHSGLQVVSDRVTLMAPVSRSSVPEMLLVRTDRRRDLIQFLVDKHIAAHVQLDLPIPLHPALSGLGCTPDDFPLAVTYCENTLALPFFSNLSFEEVAYVCRCMRSFYEYTK